MEIREATVGDVPQLCELLAELFAQEADFRPDPERQSRALKMIVGNPGIGRVYCAAEGERVVGMVTILFTVSTAEGGRAAWLEDMVVHSGRRQQGVGKRLLAHAITGAKAAGATRVTLLTDQTNAAAIAFYEAAGFVRSGMMPYRYYC